MKILTPEYRISSTVDYSHPNIAVVFLPATLTEHTHSANHSMWTRKLVEGIEVLPYTTLIWSWMIVLWCF